MRLILFFSLFLVICFGYSQEVDSSDIWFVEEEVISCDDAINIESESYKDAVKKGLVLFDFQMSECERSRNVFDSRNRINNLHENIDTTIFSIEFKYNCCGGALISVEVVDSLTWNFEVVKVDESCSECFCTCCFTTQISVKNNTGFEPEYFLFNGVDLPVSDTLIPASSEIIVCWDNGEIKFFEQYWYDKITSRIFYNEAGERLRIEYYDGNGVARKREFE